MTRLQSAVFALIVLWFVSFNVSAAMQCPQLTLTPLALSDGSTGSTYSQNLNATGGSGRYTFAIIANALPPGLALNQSSGVISGTPTTIGSFSFLIRVTDSNGCTGTRAYTVKVVCGAITLNPSSLAGAEVGTSYIQNITASTGKGPYSFSIVNGSLPPGLTLDSSGKISGVPGLGSAGIWGFGVAAVDGNPCGTVKTYSITVTCRGITVNPASLTSGTAGDSYNQTFSATGGTGPYSFGTNASALPPGLTLSVGGVLSGIPASAGSYSFLVRATDKNGCFEERSYTLLIKLACRAITVGPTLPVGQVGLAYEQTFTGSGGTLPYSFSINGGRIPIGLSFVNGHLTGTPVTAGTYEFTIRATDAQGCWGERNYTVIINNPACPSITVNPSFLSLPRIGIAYSVNFTAIGGNGTYAFSISSGSLVPGLALSANGNLTGTPTSTGTFSFGIRAIDSNGCSGERVYSLEVLPCEGITISPTGTGVPSGRVGVAYNLTFTATGGTAPYLFNLGGSSFLPPGLSLSSSGLLTGTPTTRGSYTFILGSTSANGCVGQALIFVSISDPACPALDISPNYLLPAIAGTTYSQVFSATEGTGPYTFTLDAGVLPPGVSLAINGNLTGTLTTTGSFAFSIRATDAAGCAGVKNYVVAITNQSCLGISVEPGGSTLPVATTGVSFNQGFSAIGGVAPYAFSISLGVLPAGLSLDSAGGLTGSPMTAGNYSFTVRVTDANGCFGQRTYSLVVNARTCSTITLNPLNVAGGTNGTAYNQTITATGGAAPYIFSMTSGTLPNGLSLSSSGNLTGTPLEAGSFNFNVRTTDASGCTGERAYAIVIAPGLVTSVSAASFAPGKPLAPETIVAAFGTLMSTNTEPAPAQPLPTELAGVSIRVRDSAGIDRLAPLYFVSPGQVNYQIPAGTSLGRAVLMVFNEGGLTNASLVGTGTIDVESVSPGLFSADSRGNGLAAAQAFRVKSNGGQSYEDVARYDPSQNRFVAVPIDLGAATDQVFLVLYGTGFKFRSSLSSVTCTVGGVNCEVLYAGEVMGYVGLEQINAKLPRSLTSRGEVDIVVIVDGKPANTVRVAFR